MNETIIIVLAIFAVYAFLIIMMIMMDFAKPVMYSLNLENPLWLLPIYGLWPLFLFFMVFLVLPIDGLINYIYTIRIYYQRRNACREYTSEILSCKCGRKPRFKISENLLGNEVYGIYCPRCKRSSLSQSMVGCVKYWNRDNGNEHGGLENE